jgi:DNA-binding transcriptional ArsR family regulator
MTVTDHQHPIDPERVAHARSRLPNADDAARLTGLLSLMADPVRLRLIYALDIVEELCVGDLALALDVSEDSVSYALRLLRTAGLVLTRKDGRVVFNRLADDFPAPLRDHCLRQLVALTHTGDADSDGEAELDPAARRGRDGTH